MTTPSFSQENSVMTKVTLPEAARIIASLMREHGLIDAGWTWRWDTAKRRAGICRHSVRQLGFSRPVTALATVEQFTDTVLHEIAHALVGAQHGHDSTWRRKHLEIGGNGQRCVEASAEVPQTTLVGTCAQGHEYGRFRKPKGARYCPPCHRRHGFTDQAVITWRRR